MSEKQPSVYPTALQFNVAQLLKQTTGARRGYDVEAELSGLEEQLVMAAPLRGQVRCLRVGTGILVTGDLEVTVQLQCARCLNEFHWPVRLEIEEEFRPTIDVLTGVRLDQEPDQDPATLIDEHHIMDLAEVIRQDIWLAVPASPLCSSDCKGLCPVCGQNRNQMECKCQADDVDARWMALLEDRHALDE